MIIGVTQPTAGPQYHGASVALETARRDGHTAHWYAPRTPRAGQMAFAWSDRAEIARAGHVGAWFVSVLWHRDWWALPRLVGELRGAGSAPIVIGGQCADMMTSWADAYCDILAIGDIHGDGRRALYDAIARRARGVVDMGRADTPPAPIDRPSGRLIFAALHCARQCPYCRIGSRGRSRSLTADEIVAQALAAPGPVNRARCMWRPPGSICDDELG